MKFVRKKAKPVSVLMMVLMLLLTVPFQSVFAAMIGTETVIDMTRGQEARAHLNQILAREDMKTMFIARGIDPLEAKARIEAIGVFDGQKRSIVHPVKHKVHVPIIDKRSAQILSLLGKDSVQLMDLESYETFEMPIPDEFKGRLEPGKDIQYLHALGRKKITRV